MEEACSLIIHATLLYHNGDMKNLRTCVEKIITPVADSSVTQQQQNKVRLSIVNLIQTSKMDYMSETEVTLVDCSGKEFRERVLEELARLK